MKKRKYLLLFLILFFSCQKKETTSTIFQNYGGVVPDVKTAEKIAEAIWLPIYGESILEQKPYDVRLVDDSIWLVEGSLSKYALGGTAYLEIRKADCKILKVTHYK